MDGRINPVAKHAWKFNKPKVYRDKTKYTRKKLCNLVNTSTELHKKAPQ